MNVAVLGADWCAHPGVENALAATARIAPALHTVTGGFHLVQTELAEINRVISLLHDTLKVQRVAPGHRTGELAFAVLMERFGGRRRSSARTRRGWRTVA
jgi:7,8-dihydropterin-6-yl-methyl-4-(beta-D-ribofuranosyl)aminobenzene 5'-phosphate synthase